MTKIGRNHKCPCGSGRKYKWCCGASSTGEPLKPVGITPAVAPERVHSAIIDHQHKQAIIVTNDVVTNTLHRDLPKIAEGFDQLCGAELEAELNKVMSRLFGRFAEIQSHAPLRDSDLFQTLWRLIHNATGTAFAQLHLIRFGFRLQPGSLARSVVEILSVICHLSIHEDDLQRFHQGKLQSTKAVASGKRVVPPLGEIYGHLSNEFVHVGHLHDGMNPVVAHEREDPSLDVNIAHLKMCFWLILVVSELAFFPWISSPRYWKLVGPGAYAYDPDLAERGWMRTFLQTGSSDELDPGETTPSGF